MTQIQQKTPRMTTKPKKLPQILASVVEYTLCYNPKFFLKVNLTGAAGGAVLSYTSNISPGLTKGSLNGISMTDWEKGWVGSIVNPGACVACFLAGICYDKMGRKLTMLAIVPIMALGWLLIAFAPVITVVYIGRFLTGFACGFYFVGAPMYTSEIAEANMRGMLGGGFELMFGVGGLYENVLGYVWQEEPKNVALASLVFIAAFGVLFFFQPESPLYYLKKGRDDLAESSMKRLRGSDYDVGPELEDMRSFLMNAPDGTKFREAIRTKAAKRAAVIVFALMSFQQLSGIDAVLFYTEDIFVTAEMENPSLGAIFVGVTEVLTMAVATGMIDKAGRRMLWIVSSGVMAVALILLSLFFFLCEDYKVLSPGTISKLTWWPVCTLCVYMNGFSIGVGPVLWLIAPEILPNDIRASVCSWAVGFNWFLGFVITLIFPPLTVKIGMGFFLFFFGFISVLSMLFGMYVMIETKEKSLEQIQEELGGD